MKKSFNSAEIIELDFCKTEVTFDTIYNASSGATTECYNIFAPRIIKGMINNDNDDEIFYDEED